MQYPISGVTQPYRDVSYGKRNDDVDCMVYHIPCPVERRISRSVSNGSKRALGQTQEMAVLFCLGLSVSCLGVTAKLSAPGFAAAK